MAIKALCLALTLACAVIAAPDTRIVGGTPTTIEDFPYIVALVYWYPGPGITIQRCVGGLISSWHVLTTSFCFTGAVLSNMEVRAGSTNSLSGGVVVTIREVIKHPDYQETPRVADIAVVVLESPLAITNTINILYLPPQSTYIPDGQSVKVVSWGFESEIGPQLETLKTINLKKVPLEDCQAAYAEKDTVVIDDPVICAAEEGDVGTCRGDSGAPMVIDQVVVGLSSYFQDCGTDDYPDVFTRIDRYTDWIISVATAQYRNGTTVRVKPVSY
ncbi:unnamed protein product [Parnassius apollo]|uniref:(apollo) hypothetical protein n=1 Tax=Parnassius apollo TaxID=110799 RepID=A0A8S3XTB3_PARAO|nr:unnamed protein product [Parnassius apollo]